VPKAAIVRRHLSRPESRHVQPTLPVTVGGSSPPEGFTRCEIAHRSRPLPLSGTSHQRALAREVGGELREPDSLAYRAIRG
jgi:hypothetical protein